MKNLSTLFHVVLICQLKSRKN
uniref:Uncharacterized protein n=1 Tax=Arundo donax TaxID=35708 RepID=A0A0A8ZLH8_ARUDO